MLGKTWEVKIVHIYREVNCVAGWLTNYRLTIDLLDKESDVLAKPPSRLYILLYYDMIVSIVTSSIL